jgi:cell division protein FtsB
LLQRLLQRRKCRGIVPPVLLLLLLLLCLVHCWHGGQRVRGVCDAGQPQALLLQLC